MTSLLARFFIYPPIHPPIKSRVYWWRFLIAATKSTQTPFENQVKHRIKPPNPDPTALPPP
jgi:hypothetical protein